MIRSAAAALFVMTLMGATASAQDNVMKTCGDKWQAAKAANATAGQTWPQYLTKCRADLAAAPGAAPAAPSTPAPAASGAKPAAPASPAVFPTDIAAKFAGEPPARGRQKTCGEQFRANKANNANGGLKWIEKGGGYWSQCNARLKQVRA
ncbi:MAG: hypothetical protein JWN93_429 [Hyphomicrobiales bacterium]|jgi:hypothetical protein|nr:hypothetical protein [Hyphomicrobiales bacterium]